MSICALCQREVDDKRLLAHWRDECPKAAHRMPYTPPEPFALLERVWEQIEDIMVETEFVR